jgi:hypothetical protein
MRCPAESSLADSGPFCKLVAWIRVIPALEKVTGNLIGKIPLDPPFQRGKSQEQADFHGKKEVPTGTVNRILKDAGIKK